jgi:hypothetical protein
MKTLTLNIKGRDWVFQVLPEKAYVKKFNDDSMAITIEKEKSVYFNKPDFNLVTIRHELLHVLVFSSLVESSELSSEQMEELCAEITGEHGLEIIVWSEKILNHFINK